MPTLHLIDADGTQACPAVLSSVRARMRRPGGELDRLLLLGGGALIEAAYLAGIGRDQLDSIRVPYGKAALGRHALSRWRRDHPAFDTVHCWTPGALSAAHRVYKDARLLLSLAHTPSRRGIGQVRKITRMRYGIKVTADHAPLAQRLQSLGVDCEACAFVLDETRVDSPASRPDVLTVALLSDHPGMADALDAATVVALACVTLADSTGVARPVNLLMHPLQHNRRRAEAFFATQAQAIRVVQDAQAVTPWDVAGRCHVGLALGPDAGGLSLRYALRAHLPVVASGSGPAGAIEAAADNLRLAASDAIRDLAHTMHGALVGM